MVRSCLFVTAALFATTTLAAPVPKGLTEANRRKMDECFGHLSVPYGFMACRGLFPMADQSPTVVVTYLSEKLKPLALSEKRAKELIADLGSEDKKVVEAAFTEMTYFDVRLAMPPGEAFKLAPQGPARQRLVAAWTEMPLEEYKWCKLELQRTALRGEDGGLTPNLSLQIENMPDKPVGVQTHCDLYQGGRKMGLTVPFAVDGIHHRRWNQAARAMLVLEHHGTPEAVTLLKAMVTGHPDAPPTKVAKAALDRLAKPQKPDFDGLWTDLSSLGFESDRAMLVLLKHPAGAVKMFQQKAKPFALTEKRCRELLTDLGNEDEKTWRAAWDELKTYDPRLALDVSKLFDVGPDGLARTRLAELLCDAKPDSKKGRSVDIQSIEGGWVLSDGRSRQAIPKLDYIGTPENKRLCTAVMLLDRIGTPEAVKVIEQLATGHKDAAPTKSAKYVLAERNKK